MFISSPSSISLDRCLDRSPSLSLSFFLSLSHSLSLSVSVSRTLSAPQIPVAAIARDLPILQSYVVRI